MAALAVALAAAPAGAQPAAPVTPPAPANLQVTSVGFDTVSLAWDRTPGATFYRVLVDGVRRSGVYDPTTEVAVTQLKAGTTYTLNRPGSGGGSSCE